MGKEKEVPSLVDSIDVDDCLVDVILIKVNIPDAEVEEHDRFPSQSLGSAWSTSTDFGSQSRMNSSGNDNHNGNDDQPNGGKIRMF